MGFSGYLPSGNGLIPVTDASTVTSIDVGVVRISSATGVTAPGAMMCALYIASGNNTTGLTWVPMRIDFLK